MDSFDIKFTRPKVEEWKSLPQFDCYSFSLLWCHDFVGLYLWEIHFIQFNFLCVTKSCRLVTDGSANQKMEAGYLYRPANNTSWLVSNHYCWQ